MENKSLLMDFGASRIKVGICNENDIFDVKDFSPIVPVYAKDNKFEIDLAELKNQFILIAEKYYKKHRFNNILISSQMHGFAILDINNCPLTNYISWKDERCLNKIDNVSTFEFLKEKLKDKFLKKTGMNVRACYPIFNLYHLLKENRISAKKIKVVTLADWFCACDNNSCNLSHDTMMAGLGFYNIYDKEIDSEILDLFKSFNTEIIFNKTVSKITTGGYIKLDNKNIPIYTGVGDHQCAVYGANNNEKTISLNLGTGSQIAIQNPKNKHCEKRPYFDNSYISVITHIPSGRALNTYINFLNEINPNLDYWQKISQLSLKDIEASSIKINMATFSSAWNYNNGGSIANIYENNLTLENFLSSLIKSYLVQYEKGIEFLGKTKQHTKIILSGGIPRRLPIIKEYFEKRDYKVEIAKTKYDETLEGLKKLKINSSL